jgi:hypothetical protein
MKNFPKFIEAALSLVFILFILPIVAILYLHPEIRKLWREGEQ